MVRQEPPNAAGWGWSIVSHNPRQQHLQSQALFLLSGFICTWDLPPPSTNYLLSFPTSYFALSFLSLSLSHFLLLHFSILFLHYLSNTSIGFIIPLLVQLTHSRWHSHKDECHPRNNLCASPYNQIPQWAPAYPRPRLRTINPTHPERAPLQVPSLSNLCIVPRKERAQVLPPFTTMTT